MKHLTIFLFTSLFLISHNIVSAQDSLSLPKVFPKGLSLEFGIGHFAVTDEYISIEKYSGSLPYYGLSWAKDHHDYIYNLRLDYRYSSEIKNYNVSTDIHQFTINQGFNYRLPKFSLFNKDAYVYLGPSTELFFYFNQQNIAVAGFDYAQSFAMLISLGASSKLFYKLSTNFNIDAALDFTILSLGFRMVDSEETDETPLKILTIFSATNLVFKLGPRYYFSDNLSLRAAYMFHLTTISSWEPLHSASDNIVFTLTYGF